MADSDIYVLGLAHEKFEVWNEVPHSWNSHVGHSIFMGQPK